MTRSQLKAIVKECLVEILAEGLGDRVSQQAPQQGNRASPSVAETRRRTADSTVISQQPKRAVPTVGDPVLQRLMETSTVSAAQMSQGIDAIESGKQVPHEQQVMAHGDAAAKIALTVDPTKFIDQKTIAAWGKMF